LDFGAGEAFFGRALLAGVVFFGTAFLAELARAFFFMARTLLQPTSGGQGCGFTRRRTSWPHLIGIIVDWRQSATTSGSAASRSGIEINELEVGGLPKGLVFSPDGTYLYVGISWTATCRFSGSTGRTSRTPASD
jgi:hypothetical protein